MTASILATTDNGDPAFGLKPGTLARKRDGDRALPHRSRFRGVLQSRVTRLPRPTLSPMTGRHTHEVEHDNRCLATHVFRDAQVMGQVKQTNQHL
jgi:hypothetical protein